MMNERKMAVLIAFFLVMSSFLLVYVQNAHREILHSLASKAVVQQAHLEKAEVTAEDFPAEEQIVKKVTIEERVEKLLAHATTGEDFCKLFVMLSSAERYDLAKHVWEAWDAYFMEKAKQTENLDELLRIENECPKNSASTKYILEKTKYKALEQQLEKLQQEAQ